MLQSKVDGKSMRAIPSLCMTQRPWVTMSLSGRPRACMQASLRCGVTLTCNEVCVREELCAGRTMAFLIWMHTHTHTRTLRIYRRHVIAKKLDSYLRCMHQPSCFLNLTAWCHDVRREMVCGKEGSKLMDRSRQDKESSQVTP